MVIDYVKYRESALEEARISDLLRVMPRGCRTALDIGARDGYVSRILTGYFSEVTALDLEQPAFQIERVTPVKGDVTRLDFRDKAFDVVFCLEVLEHIPPSSLEIACSEIARVAREAVVIGVPYRQDLRIGRTTCSHCGRTNPPWGHVNTFDERRLSKLFSGLRITSTTFIGSSNERTNALAAALMDFGRNPWGRYNQEEPCTFCGAEIEPPGRRTPAERAATAAAHVLNQIQSRFSDPAPLWIHVVFSTQ